MYCKCTKGSSYKVIGLCDPEKYNQTKKTAWVQITVPEILPLPECYPDIEDIERVYVNVLIESKRIIQTAVADGANVEGSFLTGKKLIVSGNICQTIVYTADNCEQSLHSINFKYPFCTSIVLDSTTKIEEDEFCVKACIEDLFAKALNPRTIFKNITLFLLAEKATTICPAQNMISGKITNNSNKTATVTVELYNELNNVIDYQTYTIKAGESQTYKFEALCDGKFKIEFETTTEGLKTDPHESSVIDIPPGAKDINSIVTTII